MQKIFGSFILMQTKEGYQGEFFNNQIKSYVAENIEVINSPAPFQGTFRTRWMEKGGNITADLQINFMDEIYTLNWSNVQDKNGAAGVIFTGRGVIKDGRLMSIYEMQKQE